MTSSVLYLDGPGTVEKTILTALLNGINLNLSLPLPDYRDDNLTTIEPTSTIYQQLEEIPCTLLASPSCFSLIIEARLLKNTTKEEADCHHQQSPPLGQTACPMWTRIDQSLHKAAKTFPDLKHHLQSINVCVLLASENEEHNHNERSSTSIDFGYEQIFNFSSKSPPPFVNNDADKQKLPTSVQNELWKKLVHSINADTTPKLAAAKRRQIVVIEGQKKGESFPAYLARCLTIITGQLQVLCQLTKKPALVMTKDKHQYLAPLAKAVHIASSTEIHPYFLDALYDDRDFVRAITRYYDWINQWNIVDENEHTLYD